MNFEQLLEPYAERQPDKRALRTAEGQIRWLQKKGLPRDIVDKALLTVYTELEGGKSFASGHDLDLYLYEVAKGMQEAEAAKQVKELEAFMATFKQQAVDEYRKLSKSTVWRRIKAVFRP